MMKELKQLVSDAVQAAGYEFVGHELANGGRKQILRVYIDSPSGVTIDDCAKASRQVGAVLDVEEAMRGAYLLEVSSPGVDRLLFEPAHYTRYLGETIKVKCRQPIDERRQFVGVLQEATDQHIVLMVDGSEQMILFSNISKANYVSEA